MKLIITLLMFSLVLPCFGVDVNQVVTTPTATFTTFNQRVTQIGSSNFETFYQNTTLPVSGKLQIPVTFKASMLGNSKFTSYNNTSHDTLEFLGGGWKFSAGCFGDSLTVLFPSTVSEVNPEWWVNTPTGGIQEALNSLRGAGTVRLSKQYNTTATIYMNKDGQHLLGTGNRKAIINYNPPSGTGTAIEIRKGALVIYDVSIKDIRITTTENTGKKTAVDAMDFSLLKIDRVSIQHFTGSQSVGIRLRGREASTIEGIFVDADIPIQISKNPNPFDENNPDETIDAQEFTFRDTYLIGSDSTRALFLLDSNIVVYGLVIEGHNAWVHGKYGLYWRNTRTIASYPVIIRNIWREQADDSTGYVIYINNASTSNFYNVEIDNVKGGDTDPNELSGGANGCNGIYLRGMLNVTLKNVMIANTKKVALNADSTVISLNLDQVSTPTTSTAILAGQRLVASFNKSSSGSPVPNTAWYVSQTQNIANFGQSKTTQQTYVSEPVSQFVGLRNQKILDILSSTDSTKIAVGASSTGARLYTYSNHPLIFGANNSDYWTVGTSGLLSGNKAQLSFQGIGVIPDTNRLLYIKNVAFNNASVDRYGFRLQLQKTAGISNYQDDFYGRYEDITFSQGSGEIGTFGGDYTSARQDSGTIGAVGNTKNAWVLKKDLDLNFGTITGSGNAGEFDIAQSSGHTITGKSNVLYLTSDWAGTTTDTTAMIRMRNGSNTDFSIYQSGQGKVKFSDTGSTTSASTGALMVPNGGVTMKNFTINGSIYSALNLSGLNACLTSIGSRKATLVIIDTVTLTAPVTIPINVDLQFSGEGFVNGAFNFVVNKASNLPVRHIWDTATNVILPQGAVDGARPEWWGDGLIAFQRAINSYNTIQLSEKTYNINFAPSNLKLKSGSRIIGSGYNTVINSTSADARPFQNLNRDSTRLVDSNIYISNLRISNNQSGSTSEFSACIDLRYIKNLHLENLWLTNAKGDGIYLLGNKNVIIENIFLRNIDRQGISVTKGEHFAIQDIYGEDIQYNIVDIEPNPGDTVTNISIKRIRRGVSNGASLNLYAAGGDSTIIYDASVEDVENGAHTFLIRGVTRGKFNGIKCNGNRTTDDAAFTVYASNDIYLKDIHSTEDSINGQKLKISSCNNVLGDNISLIGSARGDTAFSTVEILASRNVQLKNFIIKQNTNIGVWARLNTGKLLIENGYIAGEKIDTADGIQLTENEQCEIKNITIDSCSRYGINITKGNNILIDGVKLRETVKQGIYVKPTASDTIQNLTIKNVQQVGNCSEESIFLNGSNSGAVLKYINLDNIDNGNSSTWTTVNDLVANNLRVIGNVITDAAALVITTSNKIMISNFKTDSTRLDGEKFKISSCNNVNLSNFQITGADTNNTQTMEILACSTVTMSNIQIRKSADIGLWMRNNHNVKIYGLVIDSASTYGILMSPTTQNTGVEIYGYCPTNTPTGVRLQGTNNLLLDGNLSNCSTKISESGTTTTWINRSGYYSQSINDTASSTSPTTGALVVPYGGLGAKHITTDSLKVGAGSRITNIQLINDSLKITVGGVTKKFVATP